MADPGKDRDLGPEPDPESPVGSADPERIARTIALTMLERQPRTRAELARGMARRGVPEDAATAVLDRFTEVGLIDDEAFAQAWVDSRHASRALGRRALSAELRRRGVADDVVKEAVETVSADDEEAAARTLVEVKLRTMSNAPPEAKMRRLVGMLGRRGYSQGLALRVVRDVLAEASPRA